MNEKFRITNQILKDITLTKLIPTENVFLLINFPKYSFRVKQNYKYHIIKNFYAENELWH